MALAGSQWIGLTEMYRVIGEMERLNFSKAADRMQAKTMWNTASAQHTPVGLTRRFALHEAWVCLNDSDWAGKRMQLEHALEYSDPVNQGVPVAQQGQNQNQNQAGQAGNGRNAFNDASTAFHNALRTMQDQLRTLDGVWDRARWETQFRWHNTSQVEITWATLVSSVSGILPVANTRVAIANPSDEAWPGNAAATSLVNHNAITADVPADGEFLYLWSHPRTAVGNTHARCRLQLIRAGNTFVPLSMAPIAVND